HHHRYAKHARGPRRARFAVTPHVTLARAARGGRACYCNATRWWASVLMASAPVVRVARRRLFVANLFDHRREPLQAGAGAVNAVALTGDGVAQNARRIRLGNACLFETTGDGVPEGVETQPLTLEAELNQALSEKLAHS